MVGAARGDLSQPGCQGISLRTDSGERPLSPPDPPLRLLTVGPPTPSCSSWRAWEIKMYPSDFRDTAEDVRFTLLAALCSSRQAEITDALVELVVALVHKINARAERRVERQLTAELEKLRGKEGILFKLADAPIGKPDEVVRTALYPVVGEKTLRDLVAEAKANK
ncbi:hypothetical protein [Streptomyces sp. NPDC002962]|uniref:hypothetical protein n=1 Tax=Streptomyces sp. NPDC002962 TaxID=3364674 RepID=UPI0036CCED4E